MPAQARKHLGPDGKEIPRRCHHNTSCKAKVLSRTRNSHYRRVIDSGGTWDDIPSSDSIVSSDDDEAAASDDGGMVVNPGVAGPPPAARYDADFAPSVNDDDAMEAEKEAQAKFYGVRGRPALRRVASLDRGRSYPHDLMHLLFENLFPNLHSLWNGTFKGLLGDYVLSDEVWKEIEEQTIASARTIPSAFVRSLAGGFSKFTAEAWSFWFIYMLPGLLKDRFSDKKYYKHALLLGEIAKMCMQFSISQDEIDILEEKIVLWIQQFELYYYRFDPARIAACTLTVHALRHIPDDIRNCGPCWTTWTFYMERFCGFLKHGLHSRKRPHANISRRLLHLMYLEQVALRFDLTEELAIFRPPKKELSSTETSFPQYPQSILGTPRQAQHEPSDAHRSGIADYMVDIIANPAVNSALIKRYLPETMPRWSKVRIRGGDRIRAAWKAPRNADELRDNTFVRFEREVLQRAPAGETRWVPKLGYGRLDEILECEMPDKAWMGDYRKRTCLFAVITPCTRTSADASKKIVGYKRLPKTQLVLDLASVIAVVGRLELEDRWVIIDRTDGLIKPEFVPLAEPQGS
ncbi:hypothetical protein MKEN_00971900 [Mycena kentingensis (nom. inval.)]|nr:hypothetical protein MKEN_00971900 [Mycena kentingensis (nom. inval.)]